MIAACGSTKTTRTATHGTATHGTATHGPVDAAFAQRAAVVCHRGDQINHGSPPPYQTFNPQHPNVSEMPAMGRWIAAGIPPERRALSMAEHLGQPRSGASAWNHFLAAADRFIGEDQTQVTVAEQRRVKAFITSTRVLQADLNAYMGAAVIAGVRQCGGIFGPPPGPPPTTPPPAA